MWRTALVWRAMCRTCKHLPNKRLCTRHLVISALSYTCDTHKRAGNVKSSNRTCGNEPIRKTKRYLWCKLLGQTFPEINPGSSKHEPFQIKNTIVDTMFIIRVGWKQQKICDTIFWYSPRFKGSEPNDTKAYRAPVTSIISLMALPAAPISVPFAYQRRTRCNISIRT